MSTIDTFRQSFEAVVAEATTDGLAVDDLIVLDLSCVEFLSVEAIPALVEAKDLAVRHGIDFKLVTATRGVERALAATGARQVFECHATIESACTSEKPRIGILADTTVP